MVVPWSANASSTDEEDPHELDHHMDELEDEEEKEMLPYCVMPWVERLLQVPCLAMLLQLRLTFWSYAMALLRCCSCV